MLSLILGISLKNLRWEGLVCSKRDHKSALARLRTGEWNSPVAKPFVANDLWMLFKNIGE